MRMTWWKQYKLVTRVTDTTLKMLEFWLQTTSWQQPIRHQYSFRHRNRTAKRWQKFTVSGVFSSGATPFFFIISHMFLHLQPTGEGLEWHTPVNKRLCEVKRTSQIQMSRKLPETSAVLKVPQSEGDLHNHYRRSWTLPRAEPSGGKRRDQESTDPSGWAPKTSRRSSIMEGPSDWRLCFMHKVLT